MAVFHRLRKTFRTSIEYFKKSIKITSGLPESNNLADSINGLAYVYRTIGDYQKALNSFERAIEITLSNDDTNLAVFYYDLARTQKITNKIELAYDNYRISIR